MKKNSAPISICLPLLLSSFTSNPAQPGIGPEQKKLHKISLISMSG